MRGRTQLWPALMTLCALTLSAVATTFEQFRVKSLAPSENASTAVFNVNPHVRHEGSSRSALIRHGRSRGHFTRSGRDRLKKEEGHPDALADDRRNLEIDKPKKTAHESISSTKSNNNYTLESYNDELPNYNPNETLEKYFGNYRHTIPSSGTIGDLEIISNSLDKIIITEKNVIIVNKLRNETRTGYEPRFYDEEEMQTTVQKDELMESGDYVDAIRMGKVSGHVDVVTRFLRIVESQHLLGENCTAGTDLNLGEGVVDRYAQERFRVEADVAVNRANMLTRLWKYAGSQVMDSEYLLHASVFSMVEFDDDIFAAGNCYDQYQYKDYLLFCPFAYRLPEGPILVKDLAIEYKYLSNTSEWFYIARKNAERVIKNHNQFSKGFNTYTHNTSAHTERVSDEILSVTYEDGKWSKPYYDCGGGNIWMLTYTVPFFGYTNQTYFFKGTSGIDIDLRRVDIDQCPLKPGSTEINIFAATDKCKKKTTECVSVSGLGFRRGSYRCICRRGFYFPDTLATHRYYNGTLIEEQYEKLMLGEDSDYSRPGTFECVPCAEGCDACMDGSPCIAALNWLTRTAIVVLACIAIGCLPLIVLFTIKYGHVKVVRAASPVLLRVIALGALLIYSTTLVMYGRPSVLTCTLRVWLREVGFCLTYGALMLKTWRISVIFRVRSAKAVKITDMNLLRRLGMIVGVVCVLLAIRTLVAPPTVIVGRTAEDLKAFLCKTDWWDHSFTSLEVSFLVWGIRLCIMVRKAPSEFNESRFISMAIYNEFLLSLFLNISMLFLQSPANPDLMYIIFFCHTQLTVTLLLCFIFGSKAYMVLKGHGKSDGDGTGLANKLPVGKFVSKSRPAYTQYTMTADVRYKMSHNISEREIEDEFQRLLSQLEKLKERNVQLGSRKIGIKIAAMQEAVSQYDLNPVQNRNEGLKLNTMLSAVAEKLMCTTVTPGEESSSSGKDLNFESIVLAHNTKIKSNVTLSPIKTTFPGVKKKELTPCLELGFKSDNKSDFSTTLTHEVYIGPVKSVETNGVFKISGEANCGDIRAPGPESVGDNNLSVDNEVNEDKKAVSKSNVIVSPSGSNQTSNSKSAMKATGHSRTHAIIINLDDKSKFTEEVTV